MIKAKFCQQLWEVEYKKENFYFVKEKGKRKKIISNEKWKSFSSCCVN